MELRVKIDTSGAVATGKGSKVIQRNLDKAVTEATLLLDAKVKANTPQGVFGAQGGLLGSIQHDVPGKGTPLVKGMVMTDQKYAEVIEKGRKPGKGVPKGVLTGWIEKKLGISDAEELERVEYLIRWKIRARGFKGAHMFEKAADENWPTIQNIFDRYGLAITKELVE